MYNFSSGSSGLISKKEKGMRFYTHNKKLKFIGILVAALLLFPIIVFPAITVTSWKIAGPFLSNRNRTMTDGIDHLIKYGGEASIVPSPDQVFYAEQPTNGEIRWFQLEADGPNVKFTFPNASWENIKERYGRAGVSHLGYAHGEIKADEQTPVLVYTKNTQLFYVNSTIYEGESAYGSAYNGTPVILKRGRNRILVKFNDNSFSFKCVPISTDVTMLDDLDDTPDLVEGQILENVPLGIPLVNMTEETLKDISIVVRGDKYFKEQSTPVPNLAPLSTIKPPFYVTQKKNIIRSEENEVHEIAIDVVKENKVLYSRTVPLRIRKITESHRITYISDTDGSVQYFAIMYPKNYDPTKKYSLMIYLHGGGDRVFSTMFIFGPKDWSFLIAPTNRRPRGWNWWDFGRFNIYESMDVTMDRFNIDKKRVYLMGASNGGQGSWYNALKNPSVFAAIGPLAAWSSIQMDRSGLFDHSVIFSPPELRAFRDRVQWEFNTPAYVKNANNLPVVSTQGAEDTTVIPMNQRLFTKLMHFYDYDILYREIPGRPHTWVKPKVESGGTDCFDNPEIINFLKSKKLNRYPKRVISKLCDLSVNDRFYWVTINEQEKVYKDTELEATVEGGTIKITSKNVQSLELSVPPEIVPGDQVTVNWNKKSKNIKLGKERKIELGTHQNSNQFQKTKELYGPLKAAFLKPFVLVYGTDGTEEETKILLHQARFAAHRVWRVENGFTQIIPDTAVNDKIIKNFNLILFGSSERNRVTAKIARDLPIQFTRNGISIDDNLIKGELTVEMVYPNPLNPEKFIALFAANSIEAEKLSFRFNPLSAGAGIPDFVIFSDKVLYEGWGGVKATGFFSKNWDLDNKDYYIKSR